MKTKTLTNPLSKVVAAMFFTLFAGWAGFFFWHLKGEKFSSPSSSDLPVLGTVSPVVLTDQNGLAFGRSQMEGRVWIADFIFTRCAGPCPLMSARMSQLQKALRNDPAIGFLTFTVDPAYDTPEVLSRYAERYGAEAGRWFFLTGDKEAVYHLSRQSFRLGITDASDGSGDSMAQGGMITHSTKFVLVDPYFQIRGYYDSEDAEELQRLIQDAIRLSLFEKKAR